MYVRLATVTDIPVLETLVEASIREIGSTRYNEAQIASSLQYLFGIDRRVIEDQTYFVVEIGGRIVGCGGWSRRKTPFGGDQVADVRNADRRDPRTDAAVIRAFFVHPDWTRRGIGQRLLEASEHAAYAEGYQRLELVATLTGIPLYAALGYRRGKPVPITLPDGIVVEAVHMVKP